MIKGSVLAIMVSIDSQTVVLYTPGLSEKTKLQIVAIAKDRIPPIVVVK